MIEEVTKTPYEKKVDTYKAINGAHIELDKTTASVILPSENLVIRFSRKELKEIIQKIIYQ